MVPTMIHETCQVNPDPGKEAGPSATQTCPSTAPAHSNRLSIPSSYGLSPPPGWSVAVNSPPSSTAFAAIWHLHLLLRLCSASLRAVVREPPPSLPVGTTTNLPDYTSVSTQPRQEPPRDSADFEPPEAASASRRHQFSPPWLCPPLSHQICAGTPLPPTGRRGLVCATEPRRSGSFAEPPPA